MDAHAPSHRTLGRPHRNILVAHAPDRLDHKDVVSLMGHIDMSSVLIGRLKQADNKQNAAEWIFNFMRPPTQ